MTPFVIEEKGGYFGTLYGATVLFFAYLGFDMITTLSEESKRPKRDIPMSVWAALLMCAILYMLNAVSFNGMATMQELSQMEGFTPETALALAFKKRDLMWMSIIIYLCAIFGITAAAFTALMA